MGLQLPAEYLQQIQIWVPQGILKLCDSSYHAY